MVFVGNTLANLTQFLEEFFVFVLCNGNRRNFLFFLHSLPTCFYAEILAVDNCQLYCSFSIENLFTQFCNVYVAVFVVSDLKESHLQ